MADWKKIKDIKYLGYHSASDYANGGVKITVYYDAEQDPMTTLRLRFQGSADNDAYFKTNGYYLLFAPGTEKEILAPIKLPGQTWSDGGTNIKISKAYTSTSVTVPEFWICCTGSEKAYSMDDHTVYFSDYGLMSFYNYFKTGGPRQYLRHVQSGWTETSTIKYGTAASAGSVTITDNGDNTFTITSTAATAGTNNQITNTKLEWGYDANYGNTISSGTKITLTVADVTNATRRVYARQVVTAQYNNVTHTTYTDIKVYAAPQLPDTAPQFTYTKDKLTTLENYWTVSWGAATATNNSSPVTGYRIRIFKNNDSIPIKNGNNQLITTDSPEMNTARYYYDRETISPCSFNFYASKNGISGGDELQIEVYPYTKNAKGTKIFSSRSIKSVAYSVENAGIMHVKADNQWKEGQVYVKINGTWTEAEAIYTKVNGVWKVCE